MDKNRILESMTYDEYLSLVDTLVEQKASTGPNQSEAMVHYTKLNHSRMKRGNKQATLNEELIKKIEQIKTPQIWMLLTESWCGDAAANLPIIAKVASMNENIELRLVLRDENLDIMDKYLTNGGRSIPKLVIFDSDTMEEKAQWGPRPSYLQSWMEKNKKSQELTKPELNEAFQKWYNKDKGQSVAAEIISIIT